MDEPTAKTRTPSEKMMRELAGKLFEADSGLRIEQGTWKYRTIAERGAAGAKFALSDGRGILFGDVAVFASYDRSHSCRIMVKATINGYPPMNREFYVVEECLIPQESTAVQSPCL
jgi:hypothetical protein